jgi:hypothetical protein
MIPNNDPQTTQTCELLAQLRDRERRILNREGASPWQQQIELAGVQRMIGQLESQLRAKRWEMLHRRVVQLRNELRAGEKDLTKILDETLNELEEVAELAGATND